MRLLLENVARTQCGAERAAGIAAIRLWLDRGTSEAEIPVQPGRVLMHDTTSTLPWSTSLAMRDALAEAGLDPVQVRRDDESKTLGALVDSLGLRK